MKIGRDEDRNLGPLPNATPITITIGIHMHIRVFIADFENIDFPDAKTWVIDTDERLHITKEGGGNFASFNRGHWWFVSEVAPKPDAHTGPFATQ